MPVHRGPARGMPAASKSILLVEEDTDLCDLLRDVLKWNHYAATAVYNDVDAIKEVIKCDFDAILCSTTISCLSVNVFYRGVQRIRPHLCSRFLFLGAENDLDRTSFFRTYPGLPLIHKPLATDQLLNEIAVVIGKTSMELENVSIGL